MATSSERVENMWVNIGSKIEISVFILLSYAPYGISVKNSQFSCNTQYIKPGFYSAGYRSHMYMMLHMRCEENSWVPFLIIAISNPFMKGHSYAF